MDDTSAIFEHDTRVVPHVATLDGFVEGVSDTRGIDLRQLEPLTTLRVQTLNSLYRIVMTCGTFGIVQGGKFFLDPTPARIDGSGFGGSLLKMGWIGVGLNMEIFTNDQRIITSPVRAVVIERPDVLGAIH